MYTRCTLYIHPNTPPNTLQTPDILHPTRRSIASGASRGSVLCIFQPHHGERTLGREERRRGEEEREEEREKRGEEREKREEREE
jgi:hypothetical protein